MKFLRPLFLLLAVSLPALAHVGSPGVIVQKQAGPYQLLVQVMPPDVVPGTARVTVFVEKGRLASVLARPVYFRSGDEGAPTHDELLPVKGQPNQFEGFVWLMDSGSSSVQLQLDGPDGKQELVVPVVSVATAQRTMPAGTGAALAVLGLLLVILMVTIIGSSVSEGLLAPGQAKPASLKRKRLVGMGLAAVVLVLALTGGRTWWNSWANEYKTDNLFRSTPIHTSVQNGELTLRFDTTNLHANRRSRIHRASYLVPDHGKLMHLFLVRTPGLDAFAHLHPERRDTLSFGSRLPNLPAGKYLVYADIVYNSGFAETMTDTLEVPAVSASAPTLTDSDDSFLVTNALGQTSAPKLDATIALCGKPGEPVKLQDGSTMVWEEKPGSELEAGKLYAMRFAVNDPQGKPATLDPYLGMAGHMVLVRSDGGVYIHLHPVGTYSMAAETSLNTRIRDTTRSYHDPNPKRFRDSIDTYLAKLKALPEAERAQLLMPAMKHAAGSAHAGHAVEFPYAFPQAGTYRVWVQVKRAGQVLTGVFDVTVKEAIL